MIRRLGFALMVVVSGWAHLALADGEPSRGDVDACQPDIHRLCDKFFPDETLVAACLVDRRAELSAACAEILARPDEAAPAETPMKPKSSERAGPSQP